MSRAATKTEVQELHKTLAKRLKDLLLDEECNKSAAFLQVCRQFVRDQNVSVALAGDGDETADEMAEQMEELENAAFPSEFPQ